MSNESLDVIGTVTVTGAGGRDSLLVDDSLATAPRTYALTGGTLSAASAALTYSGVERLTLQAGSGGDTYAIGSLLAAPAVTVLEEKNGADTLNFAAATPAQGGVAVDLDTAAVQSLGGAAAAGPYLQLLGSFENFSGSGGNDTVYVDLLSGSGTRTIAGGGGTDTLSVDPRGQAVTDAGGSVSAAGLPDDQLLRLREQGPAGRRDPVHRQRPIRLLAGRLVRPGRQLLRPALQRHRGDDARHQRRHGAVDVFQPAAGPVRGLGQLAGSGLADDPGDVQAVRRRSERRRW